MGWQRLNMVEVKVPPGFAITFETNFMHYGVAVEESSYKYHLQLNHQEHDKADCKPEDENIVIMHTYASDCDPEDREHFFGASLRFIMPDLSTIKVSQSL